MSHTVEYTVPELLERLQTGQLPANARVQVTFDDATAPTPTASNDPTLALFEQWDQEDSKLTPETRAENDRIYAEIEQNGIPRFHL